MSKPMCPEDLRYLLRKRRFSPFRMHTTDGKSYDIAYPDQLIVLRSRAVVGAGDDNGFAGRLEHIALIHIARLEELSSELKSQQN